jgi:hypothetical protein
MEYYLKYPNCDWQEVRPEEFERVVNDAGYPDVLCKIEFPAKRVEWVRGQLIISLED